MFHLTPTSPIPIPTLSYNIFYIGTVLLQFSYFFKPKGEVLHAIMPPHEGLVHLKEYDIKDSNVELIGTEIDHKVKYNSASTEPAWRNGSIGISPGLFIWRVENFEVVPWSDDMYGSFYDGDSYIILHSVKVGSKEGNVHLAHDIFFWLGSKTSQDEAGVAAYKTVELDEFLHGAAVQHRELQEQPSEEFVGLFPRIKILRGGVASGFNHVEEAKQKDISTLLRVFKHPAAKKADSIMVVEVEPNWQSLDEEDVFVLDKGDKIWVWQGTKASPILKAKAAQIVNDLTMAKSVDVEVLGQAEARSKIVLDMLGGKDEVGDLKARRPVLSVASGRENGQGASVRPKKLFRLSDASGTLSFDLAKEDDGIKKTDLDSNDVFLLDTGSSIWVWEGSGASKAERAMWLKVAQSYIRQLQSMPESDGVHLTPVSKVVEGTESTAFLRALEP